MNALDRKLSRVFKFAHKGANNTAQQQKIRDQFTSSSRFPRTQSAVVAAATKTAVNAVAGDITPKAEFHPLAAL